jgi:glycosyltransferase involved in cell wall biosynthesis
MSVEKSLSSVTVLMSTYNGEKYLQEQLDSIYRQKDVQVNIIVRDDCSTDSTLDILKRNKAEHPELSTIIEGKRNLKPCRSFLKLISSYTSDEYYALSDQDDIWDEDKLITAVRKLNQCNPVKPALYFSNLRIVDENNKFYRNSHSVSRQTDNKYLSLIQPAVTGCTQVYNQALAKIAERIKPQNFSMHDTWMYIVAEFFGTVIYDFEPHINYRQHSNNVIGTTLSGKKKSFVKTEIQRFTNRNLQPRYDNAVEFLREFGDELSPEDLKKVLEIVNYKRTFRERMKLMNDKDFQVEDKARRIQNKLLILAGIL